MAYQAWISGVWTWNHKSHRPVVPISQASTQLVGCRVLDVLLGTYIELFGTRFAAVH